MTTDQTKKLELMIQRAHESIRAFRMQRSEHNGEHTDLLIKRTLDKAETLRAAIEDAEQIFNINCHINTLIDQPYAEEIGATADREPHMRVFRILMDYNRLREDLEQVKKLLKGLKVLP